MFAQTTTERQALNALFAKDYASAGRQFSTLLKTDQQNPVALLGLSKVWFEKHRTILKKDAFRNKFKNFESHFKMLRTAFDYSVKASKQYKKLDYEQKGTVRKAFSVTEDHIIGQYPSILMKEAYTILLNAPYRKNLLMLYQSNIYDRYADADTVEALRGHLIDQCKAYMQDYPLSPYRSKVNAMKRELLIDYTQIASIRQFGDRSGKIYEKFCDLIIEQYEPTELKHIVPQYYGAAFGFSPTNYAAHPNYRKLKEIAAANSTTPIDFLCQLNLHYNGHSEENADLYDQFIRKFAPDDIAFIALQRKASPLILKEDWRGAYAVYGKYRSLFSGSKIPKIMQLLRENSERKLRNLGRNVNSKLDEYSPVLTLDGKFLYFTRKNDETGEDIYVSQQVNGKWARAKKLSNEVNTRTHEVPMSLNPKGDTIFIYGNYSQLRNYYYVKSTERRIGKGDIYYAVKRWNGWKNLDVMKFPVNTPYYETSFSMSADGQAIFFASDRKGAQGGFNPIYPKDKLYYHGAGEFNLDIYVCTRTKIGWSEPINIGTTINTKFAEKKPFLHPDGKTLYFVSDGHYGLGGYDVFMCKRLNENSWTEWSEPVNLGKWVNSPFDDAFHITALGTTALVVSTQGLNSVGRSDIYELMVPEKYRPDPVMVISGKVESAEGKPIATTIQWEEVDNTTNKGQVTTSKEDGGYLIPFKGKKKFVYYVEDKDKFGTSVEVDLTNPNQPKVSDNQIKVSSFKKGEAQGAFEMKTLHFDHNSDKIRQESYFDLERLAKMLKANPSLRLKIEGHTDNVGQDGFNMELSQRRARAVKNFLVTKGCAAHTIIAAGYGETRPKASNNTPEGRQKNRRVEFKVN